MSVSRIDADTAGGRHSPGAHLWFGALALRGRAVLAPMAGITDLGMRRLAWRFGASLTVTEMIVGDYLARGDQASLARAAGDGEQPLVVQVAGCTPDSLAEAARIAEGCGAVAIDINMGCPAKRVTGGLAGSALMRDLDHAARLVAATVAAVAVPVSVKMRLGWDETSLNAPALARRAEAEGARLITVHGRTRSQFYKGEADWRAVAAVKRAVAVPVLVNGDCRSVDDARAMLAASGADAVMIGRAALGRPWLVGQVAEALATGHCPPPPAVAVRRQAAAEHYDAILSLFGTAKGVRHARKHLCAYGEEERRHGPVPDGLRRRLAVTEDPNEVRRLMDELFVHDAVAEAA